MFFKHFASKNQLPSFYISGTLVEKRLMFAKLLELLAIDQFVWKEDHFRSSIDEVLPCSGCFITCMGAHFAAVELDNAIRFGILSMSGFLWHSSKWACRFSRFLQYMSGLEVLACSLDTDINYVTTMLQLHLSLNPYVTLRQLLGERCSNFLGVF